MIGSIARLYRENGWLLTLRAVVNRLVRMTFSHFVGRKIGAVNFCVKPNATISGASRITIGKNFTAGDYLKLEAVVEHNGMHYEPRIVIGDNVFMNDFVHIGATNFIGIGNNVLMASKIFISDHNHGIYRGENQTSPAMPPAQRILTHDKRVEIGDNVWIGEFVSILPGVTIGEGSIIGANSVVSASIPPRSIAVGSPARVVKTYDETTGGWIAV